MDVTRVYPHGCTAYCPPSVHYHSANVWDCCIAEPHRNSGNVILWANLGGPKQRGWGAHNPLFPNSSPSGPTTSHIIHRVMALGPRDRNPLVCPVAGCMGSISLYCLPLQFPVIDTPDACPFVWHVFVIPAPPAYVPQGH